MIGYRLACRREPRFALELEDKIKNMLHQQEIGDPCEAGEQRTKRVPKS